MSEEAPLPLFPDEESDPPYVTVAKVGDILEGRGRAFSVGNRMVAVFKNQEEYFAIDDFCPHQGASLAEGYVDDGCAVVCPWHHWCFSIADGTWLENPKIGVDKFKVRVVGQEIQVQVPKA
ncbi:Rieske (2Fe-2S) protein [Aureliella helgolandensis]|uniref:3-phenylpropionate/cinnamic acid dioxygenase ferredoxin subunit n=1 Tax=Aureliella helgolandensis TaxID=2527968 RepID=A0A518GH32_9BACT|nr:Rieske (2Fe-2S) protein [Aureliella helgolandensis]QDV27905.1 3-phenylpropionate/cinnamic acid dioxygenase ferredoxin subunit [Aureliella helgolandensis]